MSTVGDVASATPLQPRAFFDGCWEGDGKMLPRPTFRWLVPSPSVQYRSEVSWLSETIWRVKEKFDFSSGLRSERTMFVELLGPDRAHVTADDMPGGAEMTLTANGFHSTPYYMWVPYAGRRWWIRCADRNVVDSNGAIHNTIAISFARTPVAAISLTIRRKN